MARKNQWQQFAENFSTFYDMGNKLQTGMASKKIMDEEVVVQATGLGPGPQSVYQANYGGKNYNEEITPEMLRGLQYDRIADVRTKFGDATGGMELREKAAGIRNDRAQLEATNLANKLKRETLDFEIEQSKYKTEGMKTDNEILEQKLAEMVATMPLEIANMELKNYGYKIDNSRNLVKLKVETATADDTIAISGLSVTSKELANKNAVLANMNLKITNSGELIQLDVDKQTKDSKIEGAKLDLKAKEIENLNNILKGTGMMYDNALGLINVETQEALQQSNIQAGIGTNEAEIEKKKAERTRAILDNNANVKLLEYSKKVANGDFKDGGGAAYLREGWTGDDETLKILKNIEDDELNNLMREGTLIIKRVEAALTGTRDQAEPAIMELIDSQDSIPNNVQILQSGDGDFLTMVQTDAEGKNPTVIAEGKDWETFKENLQDSITPMKSVTIAKANADIALIQAQTAEINLKVRNNGIDIKAVNTQWAGIEENMRAAGSEEVDIVTAKNAFIDTYIINTQGLGVEKSNNDDEYDVKLIDQ